MQDRLLSLAEVAEYLGVPLGTIYQWRAASPARGPAGIRVGRYVRVKESELNRWLAEHTEPRDDGSRAA
jgi:excisionase family DNA binding protein